MKGHKHDAKPFRPWYSVISVGAAKILSAGCVATRAGTQQAQEKSSLPRKAPYQGKKNVGEDWKAGLRACDCWATWGQWAA